MSASVDPRSSSTSTTGYTDGLGARTIRFDRTAGTALECLQVRPELRPFEDMLLEQACTINDLGDARFMRVRSIEHEHGRLVVISELASADRLCDIIEARAAGAAEGSSIDAAFGFLSKALPALSRLHAASIVHGTVAPGRVLLTSTGEIVLADAIYSTVLPRLGLSRARLWRELHVLYPADPKGAFSRADVSQAALCALQIAIGRHLHLDEPLQALPAIIDETAALAERRGGERLAASLRKLFATLLPASGEATELTADVAADQAAAIASRELGDDACATALKALLGYEAIAERAVPIATLRAVPQRDPVPTEISEPLPAVTPSGATKRDDAPTIEGRPMFGAVTGADAGAGGGQASGVVPRLLAFVKTAPLSWRIAAALAIVAATGIFAGRSYLQGGDVEAANAPVVTTPPPPVKPAAAPVAAESAGILTVTTDPAGANVLVDGVQAGQTPLRLESVRPGRHALTIVAGTTTVKRTITVEAGKTAAVEIPAFRGWVKVDAPIVLEVDEGNRSLGTTEGPRIMLAPGRHRLTLSNHALSYSSVHTVDIAAGAEAVLKVAPTGRVNLNAQPWAEVWIDGTRAGETPIANLQVPIGTRQFVFKHPQYGERKITAAVSMTPTALTVDFTKPR